MVNAIGNSSKTALDAYATMFSNASHNVANLNTDTVKPLSTVMQDTPAGGVKAVTRQSTTEDHVDLSRESVTLITAEIGMKANAKVLKAAEKTRQSVIDILA